MKFPYLFIYLLLSTFLPVTMVDVSLLLKRPTCSSGISWSVSSHLLEVLSSLAYIIFFSSSSQLLSSDLVYLILKITLAWPKVHSSFHPISPSLYSKKKKKTSIVTLSPVPTFLSPSLTSFAPIKPSDSFIFLPRSSITWCCQIQCTRLYLHLTEPLSNI